MTSIAMMPKVIIASCVLHNICLSADDNIDNVDITTDEEVVPVQRYHGSEVTKADRQAGVAKRSRIADSLHK